MDKKAHFNFYLYIYIYLLLYIYFIYIYIHISFSFGVVKKGVLCGREIRKLKFHFDHIFVEYLFEHSELNFC